MIPIISAQYFGYYFTFLMKEDEEYLRKFEKEQNERRFKRAEEEQKKIIQSSQKGKLIDLLV
jgi:hypothetical protein